MAIWSGFAKKYLVESGGARVWYVDKYQAPDLALFDLSGSIAGKGFRESTVVAYTVLDTVVESTHESNGSECACRRLEFDLRTLHS